MVPVVTRVLLAFHMPLFFWISGFLYEENRGVQERTIGIFALGKAERLLLPWVLWVFIDYGITIVEKVVNGTFFVTKMVTTILEDIIFGKSFWFLPCLFVSECIFHAISRIIRIKSQKKGVWLYFALLFWLISFLENKFVLFVLPFRLDVSMMAVGFLFFGAATHDFCIKLKRKSHVLKVFVMVMLGEISLVCIILNGRDGSNFIMASNMYGNYVYAIIGAAGLIFVNILIFDLLEKYFPKRYLLFLRKNSLLLFPLHVIILRFVRIVSTMDNINMWFAAVIRLVIIHILIVPCCNLINQYMLVLAGKKRGSAFKE